MNPLGWDDCGGLCACKGGPSNSREFPEIVKQEDLPGKITVQGSETLNAGVGRGGVLHGEGVLSESLALTHCWGWIPRLP